MSSSAGTILKKALTLSGATFASRVLGLFREILMAAVLGGGAMASAWTLAFKIPNLFRRVFGEGLLGTVLVPLIAGTLEKRGEECARKRFSTVFMYAAMLLSVCCVAVSGIALLAKLFVTQKHLVLACDLIVLVMPYCIFICLIGIMTSVLNAAKVFFKPALLSLLLNICMIAALFFVCPLFMGNDRSVLSALGISVLISGILEGILMLLLMRRYGLMPGWRFAYLRKTRILKEVWALALPGLLGALAYQGSVLTDTLLASSLHAYANAALSYSERLVYLPIGVFAVSFGTVSLSEMSHIAERKEYDLMTRTLFESLRNLLFVTVPLTVFLFSYAEEVIRAVYCRGAFDERAVQETLYALQFYVLGIPFFAMLKVVLTAFYARKDMRTPMIISLFAMGLNLVLNLILMQFLKQGGLALATAGSALIHNVILLGILHKKVNPLPWRSLIFYFCLLTGISCGAILLTKLIFTQLPLELSGTWGKYLNPVTGGGVFFLLYLIVCVILQVKEVRHFTETVLHRKRRN